MVKLKWTLPKSLTLQNGHNLKKLKDLQNFLHFCNFYHCFIQNYSHIAWPLFALSEKDVPFIWTSDQEFAFHALIHAFTTVPVIILSDSKLPFHLITDASDYALGAILKQSNSLNCWHPVAFYFKLMIDAELNYNIYNKELLLLSNLLNTSVIILKDTSKFSKFGPTTVTLHIFVPSRNYPNVKPADSFFSHSLTSQSFTNQKLLIKPMLCSGSQIIKRGCLLWKNHRFSSTQNSFRSVPDRKSVV